MPSLPKEVIMGIFDEKSKALRSEMLLKDESSSCAWLAELLILPLEQQIRKDIWHETDASKEISLSLPSSSIASIKLHYWKRWSNNRLLAQPSLSQPRQRGHSLHQCHSYQFLLTSDLRHQCTYSSLHQSDFSLY